MDIETTLYERSCLIDYGRNSIQMHAHFLGLILLFLDNCIWFDDCRFPRGKINEIFRLAQEIQDDTIETMEQLDEAHNSVEALLDKHFPHE